MESHIPRVVITKDKIYKSVTAYKRYRNWSPASRKRWYVFIHELWLKLCSGDYNHGGNHLTPGLGRVFHIELRRSVTYLLPKGPHAEAFPVAFTDPIALEVRGLLTLHWCKETSWRKKTEQLRTETTHWTRYRTKRAHVITPSAMTYFLDITVPPSVVKKIFSFLPGHTFTLPIT